MSFLMMDEQLEELLMDETYSELLVFYEITRKQTWTN